MLGPLRPRAPAERVDEITFPASANGQRILLRGWLVQFGGSKVTVCQAKYQITAEDNGVAVVACEARREYIHDWVDFTTNPMRYLHAHIEKLQSSISSWSKRSWLQTTDLPRAVTMARACPSAHGIVRGRNSLGTSPVFRRS